MVTSLVQRFLLTALVVVACDISDAEAHVGDVRRTLAIEPAGDVIHVLVHFEVSGEKRRAALRLLADVDHDGTLSKSEKKGLETQMARRALDGVRLLVGTATVSLSNAESALKMERGLPTALMVHGTAPLPKDVRRMTVVTSGAADPLTLMVRPGTQAVISATRGRPNQGMLSIAMAPIDRVSWQIAPR